MSRQRARGRAPGVRQFSNGAALAEWAGSSSAVASAFAHLREQVSLLLIGVVQIVARDFVFGFFANAFFTQSDVVVNDGEVVMEGSSHDGIDFSEGGNRVPLGRVELRAERLRGTLRPADPPRLVRMPPGRPAEGDADRNQGHEVRSGKRGTRHQGECLAEPAREVVRPAAAAGADQTFLDELCAQRVPDARRGFGINGESLRGMLDGFEVADERAAARTIAQMSASFGGTLALHPLVETIQEFATWKRTHRSVLAAR